MQEAVVRRKEDLNDSGGCKIDKSSILPGSEISPLFLLLAVNYLQINRNLQISLLH